MSNQKLREATEAEVQEILKDFMADGRAQRHMAESCGIWQPSKSILVVKKGETQLFFWIPERLRGEFSDPACGARKMVSLIHSDEICQKERAIILEAINEQSEILFAQIESYSRMDFYALLRTKGILALAVSYYRMMSFSELSLLIIMGDPIAKIVMEHMSAHDYARIYWAGSPLRVIPPIRVFYM